MVAASVKVLFYFTPELAVFINQKVECLPWRDTRATCELVIDL